jgi:phosphoglycolate phosphatase-like HAD superfamily hydrolase
MNDSKIDNLILDLDGTLISPEKAERMYREAYYGAIRKLEERGVHVPDKYKDHAYSNFHELSRKIEDFSTLYLEEYERRFNNFRREIEEEKGRARKIYEYLISTYKPNEVWILTANPKGRDIIKIILPNIPEDRVVIVNGVKYEEEKQRFLEKFKGRTLYIADTESDGEIAKKSNAEFLNIREIEKQLFESNI